MVTEVSESEGENVPLRAHGVQHLVLQTPILRFPRREAFCY